MEYGLIDSFYSGYTKKEILPIPPTPPLAIKGNFIDFESKEGAGDFA